MVAYKLAVVEIRRALDAAAFALNYNPRCETPFHKTDDVATDGDPIGYPRLRHPPGIQ
jgi:hypothetical protein